MTAVDPEPLRRHLERLLNSEPFEKSETSRKLVTYLVERSIRGDAPKETEIALDVFGKDASFNGAEDSVVRVGVRTLRQKLAEYYAGPGRDDELRFEIPKGGYRLVVLPAPKAPAPAAAHAAAGSGWPRIAIWATAIAFALLAVSLWTNFYQWTRSAAEDPAVARVRESAVWADIVASHRPVTVVLGDLFMFTQIDPKTGRTQTVRDPEINSSEELRAFLASNPAFAAERGQRYVSMIQKSAAVGMVSVLRILERSGRRVEVRIRDELQVEDVRSNDIIYLGPLSRLGPLAGHYQVQSRYRYGAERSSVTDVVSNKVFLPEGELGGHHLDYALAAKFRGPTGNRILIFTSGARNAGLLQIVRTLTSPAGVEAFDARLRAVSPRIPEAFEALLTVTGFRQTDLATEIISVSTLPAPHPPPGTLASNP